MTARFVVWVYAVGSLALATMALMFRSWSDGSTLRVNPGADLLLFGVPTALFLPAWWIASRPVRGTSQEARPEVAAR